jgi:hypothetical protein
MKKDIVSSSEASINFYRVTHGHVADTVFCIFTAVRASNLKPLAFISSVQAYTTYVNTFSRKILGFN